MHTDSFLFLNRCFAVDRDRVYALGDTILLVCDLADRASTEPATFNRIRDKDGLIALLTAQGEFRADGLIMAETVGRMALLPRASRAKVRPRPEIAGATWT